MKYIDEYRDKDLVKKLIEEGEFKTVIDKSYLLEEIADAFRYVEKGQKTGNVSIIVGEKQLQEQQPG